MHITLESDYAVRIVYHLAQADGRLDAKSISDSTEVPLRFSLKILRKLVQSGIVCSFKGSRGGYELAKLASEISLSDVIAAVEGIYTFSRCLSPEFKCQCNHCDCRFQKIYDDITETVRGKLEAVKFSDL